MTKPIDPEGPLRGRRHTADGREEADVGFAATATINRSDFHVGYGVPMVADKVELTINAGFNQK